MIKKIKNLFNNKNVPITLPKTTEEYLFCKIEGKNKNISLTLKEIKVNDVILMFYTCSNTTCKRKTNCYYISTRNFYKCLLCNTLIEGTPIYNINPISRICSNCGEKIATKIPPNIRMKNK